jgi:hypothetical protein
MEATTGGSMIFCDCSVWLSCELMMRVGMASARMSEYWPARRARVGSMPSPRITGSVTPHSTTTSTAIAATTARLT